ncbi:flagellar basal body-associated FliL family protein [Marimonas arenosa]|uniref:Flagellar protein FliL n=1 Tax=Marimonas arenosa TaxID=1795305 RepID=A0AAE4B4X5_9RHOB|nr:flagellar basal body-associated FliL family protein [Marimonas arenosa]MDQ2090562.1 flagellar basal body-associated FliL family protein [Marimonas arenosa]
MIGKVLPILLILVGVGGGIGAGLVLKPAPMPEAALAVNPCGERTEQGKDVHAAMADSHGDDHAEYDGQAHDYVKLNNQFIVPVVGQDKVESLVVMSLSVEVLAGQQEQVFKREPKLRDAFLQVLFDHANMGGFRGSFTNSNNMDVLRQALRETARKVVDDLISDVLIVDINRQDV